MKIIIYKCNKCNGFQMYSDGLKTHDSDIEVLVCIRCGNKTERKVDIKNIFENQENN